MGILVENINSIITVIYCFIIGIIIAFVISLLTKGIYGKFVDALIKNEANSEQTAKTFTELGIKNNIILCIALSHKTTLSSVISCDDKKTEIKNRRFYILPERQIKAQGIFGTEKLSLVSLAVAVLLFAGILILIQYVLPRFMLR